VSGSPFPQQENGDRPGGRKSDRLRDVAWSLVLPALAIAAFVAAALYVARG
jgi:hypothetical protein